MQRCATTVSLRQTGKAPYIKWGETYGNFKEQHQTLPIREAAIAALSRAIIEISASSLTTIGGLAAMLFMQFKIGPDMGICLMKSILFALLSVFLVMPGLLVLFGPLIEKTGHRNFVPRIDFAGKYAWRSRKVVPFVFLAVIAAGFCFSNHCPYAYGYSTITTPKLNETQIAENLIDETFTSSNMVALVVPAGDHDREAALLRELEGREEIDSAMGLANVEAMDGYMLSDPLTPRQFSELAGLDYEMAQLVYAAYATEQGDYGKLMGNVASYKVPLIDMFLFVCDQADAGILTLSDEQREMLTDAKEQMESVNAQLMKVMNLFLNVLNDTQNVNYEDVYEDVSDESLQSATRGKVLECANYGAVTADRNAGGIAGSMAIEYDLDPEDDLQTEGQRSTRFTYQTKAIPLSCQNYGTVQAKKSCAGGITGRMDLGTVSQCGGWGDVESESGDYVGGVVGLSLSSIRGSWAKCALSGGRYVGGIAGSGSRVTDCLSLVEITETAQQSGAIAGEITGDYQGNRFVSETLAGVDRVSLSGKAEAVSYDQLTALDAAPENFRRLTLRFVADGRTLKEEPFDYGASFPESAYPDAPEKDGCYVRWDRESLSELHFDTTVTAVYEPYVTTLSSDPQDAHPALLVEGRFRLGERMEAQQSTSPVPGSGSLVETWTLTLPEDGEASHTVRWRLPDTGETYTVYLKEDGAWRKTESETIGSYLRFDLPAGAQFAVAPAASRPWQLWALAGAGCAGIAVVLLLFLRKRIIKGPKGSERELQTEAH